MVVSLHTKSLVPNLSFNHAILTLDYLAQQGESFLQIILDQGKKKNYSYITA